ncbi:MAG: hypothetical protein QT04_C0006G0011 [archaeon GW2011_AR11]|nr:MAG: hypothetical protein QT04_C0006G0011 [archaeon GW2011_AR11]
MLPPLSLWGPWVGGARWMLPGATPFAMESGGCFALGCFTRRDHLHIMNAATPNNGISKTAYSRTKILVAVFISTSRVSGWARWRRSLRDTATGGNRNQAAAKKYCCRCCPLSHGACNKPRKPRAFAIALASDRAQKAMNLPSALAP